MLNVCRRMFSFLLILLFDFFCSRSLINGCSCERCNEAGYYLIHLVVCVTIFFESKIYFCFSPFG